jgi:hypothetical protein
LNEIFKNRARELEKKTKRFREGEGGNEKERRGKKREGEKVSEHNKSTFFPGISSFGLDSYYVECLATLIEKN